jgi:hypothetical protein
MGTPDCERIVRDIFTEPSEMNVPVDPDDLAVVNESVKKTAKRSRVAVAKLNLRRFIMEVLAYKIHR